jgi:hypothetical protein
MRAVLLAALACLAATAVQAAPLSAADQAKFAGEWRANPQKPDGACGQNAGVGDMRFTLEFAVTGGQMFIDDGTEASQTYAVKLDANAKAANFDLGKDGSWKFTRKGDALISDSPPELYAEQKGLVFHRCRAAADRSAIKLNKDQIAAVSAAMPPDHTIFVDARAKKGCKALDYQYLTFDLVGPLGFTLGRWNSGHLGEQLAGGKKPKLAVDQVSNWTIDKAEAVANGYKFTITELIPPNNSRGDTTTITLAPTIDGRASVPEWKRIYLRCSANQLSAE